MGSPRTLTIITNVTAIILGILAVCIGIAYTGHIEPSSLFKLSITLQVTLILLIIGGVLVVIWGAFGFPMMRANSNQKVATYLLFGLVILAICISLLIITGMAVFQSIPFKRADSTCLRDPEMMYLGWVNQAVSYVFCQFGPEGCQCRFQGSQDTASVKRMHNSSPFSGPVNIQECQRNSIRITDNDVVTRQELDEVAMLMSSIESSFACVGMCSNNMFYLFTNVNNQVSNYDCRIATLDFLAAFFKIVFIITGIFLLMFFINLVHACFCAENAPYQRSIGAYSS